MTAVQYRLDGRIAHLVLDEPSASVNTMNVAYRDGMAVAIDALEADVAADAVDGVVLSSGKSTFSVGGDLRMMTAATDAADVFALVESIKHGLRRLETIGRPVVAVIGGAAVGGGLEIALAAHHRIAVDGVYEIGLPEATIGVLPGGGGVTRTVRMLGLQRALAEVLLEGKRMSPRAAREVGLVDELVETSALLMPAAIAWIEAHLDDADASSQPWDRPGYRMPGGTPSSPSLAALLPAFPPSLRAKLKGAPLQAPRRILEVAVEGAQVDVDTASRIESRAVTELILSPQFRNLAQALFFDLNAVNAGASRPAGAFRMRVERLGVVGAGMMGAAIAHVAARAGIEVVLADVSLEAAQRGRAHAERELDARVARGRLDATERDAVLARITPTAQLADLAQCDAVIEAVVESLEVKRRIFADLEGIVAPGTLLGTNTSTLPITSIAEGLDRADDVIGIHFFSPVERMPLIEVIVGTHTSDTALARAIDLAAQLRKSAIVVNDSRGFFTSRVFGTLVMEAARMVGEGVSPVLIERAASMAGFPGQPLAMLDEVSLTLPQHVAAEARAAEEARSLSALRLASLAQEPPNVPRSLSEPKARRSAPPADSDSLSALRLASLAQGPPNVSRSLSEPEARRSALPDPAMHVIDTLVDLRRTGKSAGAGFYDYPPDGSRKRLWPGLTELFTQDDHVPNDIPLADIQDRLTFVMSVESLRVLEEGVVRTVAEANVGSILGIGFPAHLGGVIQHANGYAGVDGQPESRGIRGYTARADELADRYGERFRPPEILRHHAERGTRIVAPPPEPALEEGAA